MVFWGLGVWKLMTSGISGLALQRYVSMESLAGTMACMSTAFVLVDNFKLGTWGRGLLGSQERRARSRMYVKRKGKGVQWFSLFWNGQHHQPAWYKRSCSVFYRARKGAALDVEVYEIAPSCMSTDNGTASGKEKPIKLPHCATAVCQIRCIGKDGHRLPSSITILLGCHGP